jgi:hypothetical protein
LRTLEVVGGGTDRVRAICSQSDKIRGLHDAVVSRIPSPSKRWVNETAKKMLERTPQHIVEEFEGISERTGCPVIGIATLNFLDELARLADLGRYVNSMACSSLGVCSTIDGATIVGRNLDYEILLPELRAETYRYAHMDHGYGYDYISWSWPGFIGITTGLNSKGLWLATHTAISYNQSISGVPNGILYRMVMEQASSIKDANEIIRDNLPACASNIMLAQLGAGEAAILEVDNKSAKFRKDHTSRNRLFRYCACANHFQVIEGDQTADSYLRQHYLDSKAEKMGKVSLSPVAKAMASPDILNDITVYSIVTDGKTVLEQIGGGIRSDESHYDHSTLDI